MCKRILAVPVMARGKLVRCRNCGQTLRIPAKPEGEQPAPAAVPKKDGA
jgi:hypothetical protein